MVMVFRVVVVNASTSSSVDTGFLPCVRYWFDMPSRYANVQCQSISSCRGNVPIISTTCCCNLKLQHHSTLDSVKRQLITAVITNELSMRDSRRKRMTKTCLLISLPFLNQMGVFIKDVFLKISPHHTTQYH